MHPHAFHAFTFYIFLGPAQLQRHGHQPAAMAFAVQPWDQAEKADFALALFAEIEFQDADFYAAQVSDGPDFDLWVVDDRSQFRVGHDEAGEPQPRFAHAAIERSVFVWRRGFPAFELQFRVRRRAQWRFAGHFQRGDDGRDVACGDGGEGQLTLSVCAELVEAQSAQPPVLRQAQD